MSMGITGKEAEEALDAVNITCNKNAIPFDQQKPNVTSGVRLGTAAMTSRGFGEAEFRQVGTWITQILKDRENEELKARVKAEVIALTQRFPLQ